MGSVLKNEPKLRTKNGNKSYKTKEKRGLTSNIVTFEAPPPIHTYIHIVASLSVEILLLLLFLSHSQLSNSQQPPPQSHRPNTARRDFILLGFHFLLYLPIPVVLGRQTSRTPHLRSLHLLYIPKSSVTIIFCFSFLPNVVISVNLSSFRFVTLCKLLLFDSHCCPISVCEFG